MIHVCLTHDIDRIDKTYQHLTKPLRALAGGNFRLFFRRLVSPLRVRHPYWGFDRIVEIESRFKVKSTCFFMSESVRFELFKPKTWKLSLGRYKMSDPRICNIIRQLDSEGWEVGLHGSYNSFRDYDLMKKEKAELEQILGHQVIGIRQHYLNLSDETWSIQQRCGFLYDSTWGPEESIGFKDGKVLPFFPLEDKTFCEIPMTIMDTPFSLTKDRWEKFEEIAAKVDAENAYLVINYHNSNYEKYDFVGYEENYVKMIEKLLGRGAEFMTMSEAYHRIMES